jgi:hypothetical protein
VNRIAQLLLGAWIGGMGVTIYTATRSFAVLESHQIAGDLMGGIFKMVDIFGIVAAGFAAFAWIQSKPRLIVAGLMLACAAFSAFYVNAKIVEPGSARAWHHVGTGLWLAMLVGAVGLSLMGPPKDA